MVDDFPIQMIKENFNIDKTFACIVDKIKHQSGKTYSQIVASITSEPDLISIMLSLLQCNRQFYILSILSSESKDKIPINDLLLFIKNNIKDTQMNIDIIDMSSYTFDDNERVAITNFLNKYGLCIDNRISCPTGKSCSNNTCV